MIDRNRYFEGGKFLKAADVKDGTKFTIDKFEEIKTRIGLRPILRLVGVEVPLGLNATNLDQLVELYGENEKKWNGKKITLRLVETTNPQQGGKVCTGIRIA